MATFQRKLDTYIDQYNPDSPLTGQMFMRMSGGNPKLAGLLAVLAHKESSFGTAGSWTRGHNAWGYGVKKGPSVNSAPDWVTMGRRVLSGLQGPLYKGAGLDTIDEIIPKYAPSFENNTAQYIQQAKQRLQALGINPNESLFDGTANPESSESIVAAAKRRVSATPAQQEASMAPTIAASMIQRKPGESLFRSVVNGVMQQKMTEAMQPEQKVPVDASADRKQPGNANRQNEQPETAVTASDYKSNGKIAAILPTNPNWGGYGYPDPEGQGGRHLATDWFAPAGTRTASPANGTVVRYTPDPTPGKRASGQVFGGTVGIRDEDGRLWVMRHITPGRLKVGQRVTAGQVVGRVKDWGPSSHIHLETYKAGSGDREYSPGMALNPGEIYRAAGLYK